jgi:hypothetical protein
VLKSARENLAAIRGLAEIHHRRGELGEALTQYRAALALARNDPELAHTVSELSRKVEPAKPAHSAGGLSFEQAQRELSVHAPIAEPESIAPPPVAPVTIASPLAGPEAFAPPLAGPEAFALPLAGSETIALPPTPAPSRPPAQAQFTPPAVALVFAADVTAPVTPSPEAPAFVAAMAPPPSPSYQTQSIEDDSTRARAARTIVALELWLGAIHVARAHRRA